MKYKKIMLVSLFLLAILTLGAVSAAEDADGLAAEDVAEEQIDSPAEDVDNGGAELASDDESSLSSEDLDMEVKFPDTVTYGYNDVYVNITNEDAQGTLVIYVDDDSEGYYDETEVNGAYDNWWGFSTGFGKHTVYVKYFGDEKYGDVVKSFAFDATDYVISFENDADYAYGVENTLTFYMPENAEGDINVYVNNNIVARDIKTSGWSESRVTLNKDALSYGDNTVKVEFIPFYDYSIFKYKTVETVIQAKGYIQIPETIVYNGGEEIRLVLPNDANGKLSIKIDEEDAILIDGNEGVFSYILPKLSVGSHSITANYSGDEKYSANEYEEYDFNVIPKVICPKHININENNFVSIEMDEKYTGTFTLYRLVYEGDPILVGEVTLIEGKGKIQLTDLEAERYYSFRAVYSEEGNEMFYFPEEYGEYDVYATRASHDWKIELDVPEDVMKAPNQKFEIIKSPSFTPSGIGELYIDGEDNKVECEYEGFSSIIFDASGLSEGPHSFVFKFLGDDYFNPTEVSGSFNVTYVVIEIPETYDMYNFDGHITVKLPIDATGTIKVNAGSEEIFNKEIVYDEYYDDEMEIVVELDKLAFGMNDVTVIVEGKYSATKSGKINATYPLGIGQDHVRYGEGEVVLDVPTDLTSDVTLIIDGTPYKAIKKVTTHDMDYIDFIVKLPVDLAVGNHEVTIKYGGDKKYGAREAIVNLTVIPEILIPSNTVDKYNEEISITMPENAIGALSIKIGKNDEGTLNWINEINITLENGFARYSLKDLDWGKYTVIANYTGTDYKVWELPDEGVEFTINPEISYPSKIVEGDNKYITINLPNVKGTLTLENDEFYKEVKLVNGKASIPLNVLPAGLNGLYVKFYHEYVVGYDDEGNPSEQDDSYDWEIDITVQKPVIKASNLNAIYTANSVYKVQITGVDKNFIVGDKVTFKIANKVIGTGTIDKNGYASIKIKQLPGNYKITTVYKKASVTKSLTVKHIVTLKTVKVKKSAKKLVLQATVKVGKKPLAKKKVTFKFNGKTYKATTNKNGIAKVTIKNKVLKKLKVGKKITYQATCLKDTVKKSVKVKK